MSIDLLERIMLKAAHIGQNNDLKGPSDSPIQYDEYFTPANTLDNSPFEVFQPLPAYSTVLGICEDGLPLILDLNDPNPGAILISGRSHTGKTQLLRSILVSACSSNSVEQLYFYLISPDPGSHIDLRNLDQCYGVFSAYDKSACELIVDLSGLVEQRKSGRHLGVKCILAIDNLYEFIKHQDFEVINHLKWLSQFGANNGIWMISTIETDRSNLVETELLNEQKTHILSGSDRRRIPEMTSDNQQEQHLQCFRTRIGSEWIDFWLPSVS